MNVYDVSFSDLEDSLDNVSGNDFVLDSWLDPLGVSSADVSSNDIQTFTVANEVDLSQIESSLFSIEKYCNLGFTLLLFYIGYRFIRGVVYRFNSKGKDIS